MSRVNEIAAHYAHSTLTEVIAAGVLKLGKTTDSICIDDLAPVDEFHIGGRQASIEFLDQLNLTAQTKVLDVGCGIGGSARFVAQHYGANVSGIDLTEEYVNTARDLSNWLNLNEQVNFRQGTALELPFDNDTFERGYMMHVGMNIEDKFALFAEFARVLKPAAIFGIYDVMRIGEGDLTFPVPWAATDATSAVVTPNDYKKALTAAGFRVSAERNRQRFAIEFFDTLRTNAEPRSGLPPLGLHILMGDTAPLKRKNMLENISAGRIAPVEIIAEFDAV